jgi:hypothetical protein
MMRCMCGVLECHFEWKATRVVGFQEARACSHEDPMQSVAPSPIIVNNQVQSSAEGDVRVINLEQKHKVSSIMPLTRITPHGNWAVGLQVPNLTYDLLALVASACKGLYCPYF